MRLFHFCGYALPKASDQSNNKTISNKSKQWINQLYLKRQWAFEVVTCVCRIKTNSCLGTLCLLFAVKSGNWKCRINPQRSECKREKRYDSFLFCFVFRFTPDSVKIDKSTSHLHSNFISFQSASLAKRSKIDYTHVPRMFGTVETVE